MRKDDKYQVQQALGNGDGRWTPSEDLGKVLPSRWLSRLKCRNFFAVTKDGACCCWLFRCWSKGLFRGNEGPLVSGSGGPSQ